MRLSLPILLFSFLLAFLNTSAQEKEIVVPPKDTGVVAVPSSAVVKKDSVNKRTPGKAALRSAIIPGWGQAYNKKYWKIPIVYGALGVTTGIFIYNYNNYRETRFAYKVKYNMRVNHTDTALFTQIKPHLKPLSEESLRFYRDQFRRDIDYSALVFILLWGLNVVDAAVDAHLKTFDVSPDLSLQIRPGHSQFAGTTGVSLVLAIR